MTIRLLITVFILLFSSGCTKLQNHGVVFEKEQIDEISKIKGKNRNTVLFNLGQPSFTLEEKGVTKDYYISYKQKERQINKKKLLNYKMLEVLYKNDVVQKIRQEKKQKIKISSPTRADFLTYRHGPFFYTGKIISWPFVKLYKITFKKDKENKKDKIK